MKSLVVIPRMSEKAYAGSLQAEQKTYVFVVPVSANKHAIARAVAEQYSVGVQAVRTTTSKGKTKQSYRKNQRPQSGQRSDFKKAYVTLQPGDSLPLFSDIQADAPAEAKKETK